MTSSREQIVEELHKPARRRFKRRNFITRGLNDTWQIDLVEMIPYASVNKGYKYILTVIDTFSKQAYARPVKKKTAEEVENAMRDIFLSCKQTPRLIHSDRGKEFFNKKFKKLMDEYNIEHYHTYTEMKAAIVERFNRTLKNRMWKEFSLNGNYKWIELLPKLINSYNNTKHSTIKIKPKDVTSKNEKQILKSVYKKIKIFRQQKFKVGDFVRISRFKNNFDKGYTPNWSPEIFKIIKINLFDPLTYILEDYEGNKIKGSFYMEELQKVVDNNAYLVEKIVKRRGNMIYVKFLGFDDKHNTWINKADLV
jgi:hypothetical protein